MEDPKREKPVIEVTRVWAHGDSQPATETGQVAGKNRGLDCPKYNEPIYTEPDKTPGVCEGQGCANDEWFSKGRWLRDKATKQILREIK